MYDYGQSAFKVDMVVDLGLYLDVRHVRISSLTQLLPLVERLEMRMRLLGYSRKDIFATILALVEVTTNAVRHGNRQDPTKHVLVSYVIDPDEILIEVEDEVSMDALSADIRAGLLAKAGHGKIVRVESITKKDKLVAYEAQILAGGKKSEVQVGPDGKPLDHEE